MYRVASLLIGAALLVSAVPATAQNYAQVASGEGMSAETRMAGRRLTCSIERVGDDVLQIRLINSAGVTLPARTLLVARSPEGVALTAARANGVVLPGESRTWRARGVADACYGETAY